MDFQLRQATPEDAEAVVLMQTQAHEECYPHLLSAEFFQRRRASIPERVERRRPFLATDQPRIRALAFYLKQGFRPDGKRNTLPPEWEALPEFRLVRRGTEPDGE